MTPHWTFTLGNVHRTGELVYNRYWREGYYERGMFVAQDHVAFYSPEQDYFAWHRAVERWLVPVC